MRKHLIVMAGVVALCAAPAVCGAQESPPPGAMGQPSPPAACPPGTSPAYQTSPGVGAPGMTPVPYPPPAPTETTYQEKPRKDFAPHQVAIMAGGGVADFVRNRINDSTGISGAWDGRLIVGTRSYLGFEAAYLGTSAGVNETTDFNSGHITSTQVTGSLRLNATVKSRVQPFLTAGAGWAHFSRSGSPTVAETGTSFAATQNGFDAPFGAGIAGYIGRHGVLDARGSYNLITGKDFSSERVRPDMWTAELRLGYAF